MLVQKKKKKSSGNSEGKYTDFIQEGPTLLKRDLDGLGHSVPPPSHTHIKSHVHVHMHLGLHTSHILIYTHMVNYLRAYSTDLI